MSTNEVRAWAALDDSEHDSPLIAGLDDSLRPHFETICVSEDALEALIHRFGASRSLAHAFGLIMTTCGFARRVGMRDAARLLLLFEKLRFKNHYGTVQSLLSLVSYTLQRGQMCRPMWPLDHLCESSLAMCETLLTSDGDRYIGPVADCLDVLDVVVSCALMEELFSSTASLEKVTLRISVVRQISLRLSNENRALST